jgi:glutamate formiminotransferase/glutamate formiminotransferase/formiminotetrahydrofolate cyclodeaminase
MPTLLAVPNVSEGCERAVIDAVGHAFASADARLLDVHSDCDHQRSVYTLAGEPGGLADALLAGARAALARIDIRDGRGAHPHVGALDVLPVVYLDECDRGAACAEALVLADRVGEELAVPVFLYGALAGGRTRAEVRQGGASGLARRIASGECRPEFGPAQLHESAGATLVAAREPLVAFNLELTPPATVEDARRIAALVREGGAEGLPGVRAIGVALDARARGKHDGTDRDAEANAEAGRWIAQVSMNVEHPARVPLAEVLRSVRRHADVLRAELVGLAPRAALEGFPQDVPIAGFDPERHVIENALASS